MMLGHTFIAAILLKPLVVLMISVQGSILLENPRGRHHRNPDNHTTLVLQQDNICGLSSYIERGSPNETEVTDFSYKV